MTKHIAFPSIPQFRNVIKEVRETAKYHREVEPTLTFTGSVKLHGTNHAVCMSPEGTIYTQSRERLTSIDNDNAGSAAWTLAHEAELRHVFEQVINTNTVLVNETIQIFGEFCGGSIQKGVGLNNIDKTFVVFAIRISEDSDSQKFLSPEEVQNACGTYVLCIYNFPMYKVDIDFLRPELSQETIVELTKAVEKDCPVARELLGNDFAKELIGEGIVWSTVYKGNTLRFKVKGEKHSSSKVKTLALVDVEKMSSIHEFVSAVLTESRLAQGLEHVTERDPKYTGDFIRWVMQDVLKEEMDTILENGFTNKDITGHISKAARNWFLT